MTSRPTPRAVLATTVAATALLLSASGGASALAATTATPAKGTGTSELQVLTLTAAGHTLSIGGLQLVSDTLSGTPLASVTVTPVVADDVEVGQQVVTPSNSPLTIPSASTPGALAALASLTSPAFTAAATTAPATTVGSTDLGTVSLFGGTVDVPLNGSVSLGSAVSDSLASAQKTVTVEDLALPSIADLLAGLGLDITALPTGVLTDLIDALDLTTAAIDTAMGAVDAAQAQVDTAQAAVTAATTAVTNATAAAAAAQTAFDTATTALNAEIAQIGGLVGLLSGVDTIAEYAALDAGELALVEAVLPNADTAYASYLSAQTALTAADAAVVTAQGVLDTAQTTLTGLLATLNAALDVVDDLAAALLDTVPLLSLDKLSVSSKAVSTSNTPGGQVAEVTGGTIEGLNVLGTDVLDTVLGSSTLDVVDLVGDTADDVTAVIGDLTGALSEVLSTVPGFPALEIPAPQIEVMKATTSTSIADGFGNALASVTGLKVTLPAITLPTDLALTGAADLPLLQGVTQPLDALTSAPISLEVATLSDQSAYSPAVVPSGNAPTTPSVDPNLAATGMPAGLAATALVLVGGGLVLRRRRAVS